MFGSTFLNLITYKIKRKCTNIFRCYREVNVRYIICLYFEDVKFQSKTCVTCSPFIAFYNCDKNTLLSGLHGNKILFGIKLKIIISKNDFEKCPKSANLQLNLKMLTLMSIKRRTKCIQLIGDYVEKYSKNH